MRFALKCILFDNSKVFAFDRVNATSSADIVEAHIEHVSNKLQRLALFDCSKGFLVETEQVFIRVRARTFL